MDDLKIVWILISHLTPYENNTRKHTQKDIDQIKASILADGFNDPIGVWGEKNVIVEGHGRLEACKQLGIRRPAMYDMGYSNNNCIGCVKGGAGYWNKIRVDFPEVFRARAKMERDIGHSILKECFLDELPEDKGRMSEEIMEECSILCQLAIME